MTPTRATCLRWIRFAMAAGCLFAGACSQDTKQMDDDTATDASTLKSSKSSQSPGHTSTETAEVPPGEVKTMEVLGSADYVHRQGGDPQVFLDLIENNAWIVLDVDEGEPDDLSVVSLALAASESLHGAVRVAVDVGDLVLNSEEFGIDFFASPADGRCRPQWCIYKDGIQLSGGCGRTTEKRIRQQMVSVLAYEIGNDRDLLKAGMIRVGPKEQSLAAMDDEEQGRLRYFMSGESGDFDVVFRDAPPRAVPLKNNARQAEGEESQGTWLILFAGVWSHRHSVHVLDAAEHFSSLNSDASLGVRFFNEWDEIAEWFPEFKHLPSYEPLWVALQDGQIVDTKIGYLSASDLGLMLGKARQSASDPKARDRD